MWTTILPWWVRWAVLAALCAAVWIGGYITASHHQKARAEAIQAKFDAFKAQTEAAGRQAAGVAKAKEAAAQQLKGNADAENLRTSADLRARLERLRHASATSVILPAAPAGARRPDLACYDRTELERALRGFMEEARGLIDEGSQAAVDLNSAREWVANLKIAEAMTVK